MPKTKKIIKTFKAKKPVQKRKRGRPAILTSKQTKKLPLPTEPQKPAEPSQAPRGMRDILTTDKAVWDVLEKKIADLARAFGYGHIETPILEYKSLFTRGVGATTDIVQKEMYCFKDHGEDELCLRPEGTAAAARAYINHGMLNLPQPVKLWYLGPFFRRERPQSGRYRQFHQWGVEAFGDDHPVLDAEIISIAMRLFSEFGLPVCLEINSIGCVQCRENYKNELLKFYEPKQELLCETCRHRLQTNRLRLLDCKEPQCELIREGAPQITDFICEPCRNHFMEVLGYLDEVPVLYNLNPFIVRGLDYYNRTVFEIVPAPEDREQKTEEGDEERKNENDSPKRETEKTGAQVALCAGGRYDGLIEQLGGRPAPGVGFALGIERTAAFLKNKNPALEKASAPQIFIAQLGDAARRKALTLWHEVVKDIPAAAALSKEGLKAQLEIANRLQVRYAIILGQKEIIDKTVIIRDMEAGIQEIVDYNKLISVIKRKIEGDN